MVLDAQLKDLMDQMNIPQAGRAGMLNMNPKQKKGLIDQFQAQLAAKQSGKKKGPSGKEWSKKFNSTDVKWNILKDFEVVLKASDKEFANDFIQELGLKRLCRVSREHNNAKFDQQILAVFKAIMNTSPDVIKHIINDDQTIITIVSKVNNRKIASYSFISYIIAIIHSYTSNCTNSTSYPLNAA